MFGGTIMRPAMAFGLALAASMPALAAPQDPVTDFLAAASRNGEPNATRYEDYFSDVRLDTIYSRAFAATFRNAWARAADEDEDEDEDEGIFEMDFVINAQDGCPFENLKLAEAPQGKDATQVDARFNAFRCLTSDEDTKRISHVAFR